MDFKHYGNKSSARHETFPHPTQVVPFGRYGAGLWTGHPIGLVIVLRTHAKITSQIRGDRVVPIR